MTARQLEVLAQLHDDHQGAVTVFDNGRIRLIWPEAGWQHLSGGISDWNRAAVLAVINDSARGGRRNLDLSALREVDRDSLHALLTSASGLHLPRPSPWCVE